LTTDRPASRIGRPNKPVHHRRFFKKRYIDLSGRVENGLWAYDVLPGLEKIIPRASIETIATGKEDDFFASKVTLSTVTDTYLEAGSHILEGGKTLD
jgi:kynurenine formamidase